MEPKHVKPPEEPDLRAFARERAFVSLKMAIFITLETMLLAFWIVLSWLLGEVADFFKNRGGYELCAELLRDIGPWFILAIALVHLAHDLKKEAAEKLWPQLNKPLP